MKSTYEPAALIEKDRIRLQISAHVDEFLRCGGKIKVLDDPGARNRASIGSAWASQDELPDILD
ncbi:MAG: hypothetical protein V2I26_18845 [Halieaceae bacterium]|jgi:hypothetical protein|nr:hypothetical protein [Halieaceae bacterium]